MDTTPLYYVYVLARPNGKPFYVGKGKKSRAYAHATEARSGHKCHKCSVIRKIWRQGGKVQTYFVFTTESEQDAFTYEQEMIALFGRENLCNHTDGGEGASGTTPGASTRRRLSITSKKRWADPTYHQRTAAAIRAAQTEEYRARISATMKAKIAADPAWRARMGEISRASNNKPENKARQSEQMRQRMQDPDYVAKTVAGVQATEHRARQGETFKARWADPEFRARMSAAQKARWARKRAETQSRQIPPAVSTHPRIGLDDL